MFVIALVAAGLGLTVVLAARLADGRAKNQAWDRVAANRRVNAERQRRLEELAIELDVREDELDRRERRLLAREDRLHLRELTPDAAGHGR